MLVGNRVPYAAKHLATEAERQTWERHRAEFNARAQSGFDVKETLAYIRHPGWEWHADAAAAQAASTPHQGR